MISRLYRAYCRSVTRAQCNPAVLAIALAIIILSYLGDRYVTMHERGILQGLRDAAAAGLCAGGMAILAAAIRSSGRARAVTPMALPAPEPARIVPDDAAVMTAQADALASGILDIRVSGDGRDLIEIGPVK